MTDDNSDFDAQSEVDFLRDTFAQDVLANHYFVLAQWAAVHLASSPPDLEGSQLVIDVMAAMLDTGGERLGANLALYRTALSEIQQAFVRATMTTRSVGGDDGPAPSDGATRAD